MSAPHGEADSTDRVVPRPLVSAAEQIVAEVWSAVLGCPVTSADDDFFDLGGHSLTAARAAARLRKASGVRVPVPLIFELRSVGAVAAALDSILTESGQKESGLQEPVPPVAGPDPAEPSTAPLSRQQQAIWASAQALADTPFNNVLLPLRLTGPFSLGAFRTALTEVIAQHQALRTAFTAVNGDIVQSVRPAVAPTVDEVDLSMTNGADQEDRARIEAKALYSEPFDLSAGRPLRVRVLRFSAEEQLVLLCTHHIVCDGVSFQILLEDLAAAYGRVVVGEPGEIATKTPGYAEYARQQRAAATAGAEQQTVAYWSTKLARPVGPAAWQTDASVRNDQFRFGTARLDVRGGLWTRLQDFAQRYAATPFMVIVAAAAALVHLGNGERLIRIATLMANREQWEYERTVGLFATTVILEASVQPGVTFDQLIATVREDSLTSFAHQQLPLESVIPHLPHDLRRNPNALFHLGISWEPQRRSCEAAGVSFAFYTPDEPVDLLPVLASSTGVAVTVREEPDGLICTLEYRTQLFGHTRAESLLCDMRELLDRHLADPSLPLTAPAGTTIGPDLFKERK